MPKATIIHGAQSINHCYMTGQTCVYLRDLLSGDRSGAFVLSPFSSDFNHDYEHALSKIQLPRVGIAGSVRRADSVARTGYVMCSRICYPIQQSEAIIADITRPNLNVFYELGLACALGKRLLLIAHESLAPDYVKAFVNRIGLANHVEYYSSDSQPIAEAALDKCKKPRSFAKLSKPLDIARDHSVTIFSNEDESYLKLPQGIRSRKRKIADLAAAALDELCGQQQKQVVALRINALLRETGDTHRGVTVKQEDVVDYTASLKEGLYCYQNEVGRISALDAIRQAEFVMIDTSLDDFETYFWLGVCHGVQKEVIPLSVSDERILEISLPFDVRTLWHVEGSFSNGDHLRRQLLQIFCEIISKMMATYTVKSRNRFWADIVHTHKLSFYLATEQSKHLASKQVMGEWDLRTFQEIASFALRSNPNLDVVIEKPIFRRDSYSAADKVSFQRLLRTRMANSHCIVIGSPDVNPVAEMLLSELKGVQPFTKWLRVRGSRTPHTAPKRGSKPEGYIPFKNHLYEYSAPPSNTFFAQFDDKEPIRGFLYYDKQGKYQGEYAQTYVPRERAVPDEPSPKFAEWKLVAHLVVAPNPFNARWKVVLLMGVGGPATLGLAHLLTGRPPENQFYKWRDEDEVVKNFMVASEEFLARLDSLIDQVGAAEAIVKVTVKNDLASRNNEFEDSREIINIELAESLQNLENPKAFEVSDSATVRG